jgi:hypothetical protein
MYTHTLSLTYTYTYMHKYSSCDTFLQAFVPLFMYTYIYIHIHTYTNIQLLRYFPSGILATMLAISAIELGTASRSAFVKGSDTPRYVCAHTCTYVNIHTWNSFEFVKGCDTPRNCDIPRNYMQTHAHT